VHTARNIGSPTIPFQRGSAGTLHQALPGANEAPPRASIYVQEPKRDGGKVVGRKLSFMFELVESVLEGLQREGASGGAERRGRGGIKREGAAALGDQLSLVDRVTSCAGNSPLFATYPATIITAPYALRREKEQKRISMPWPQSGLPN
jgi:hypothetical protein